MTERELGEAFYKLVKKAELCPIVDDVWEVVESTGRFKCTWKRKSDGIMETPLRVGFRRYLDPANYKLGDKVRVTVTTIED